MTKIWNAARFIEMHSEDNNYLNYKLNENGFSPDDQYILSKLNDVISEVNENINRYRFNDASLALYDFFWHNFCDRYLEYAKPILYKGSDDQKLRTLSILHLVFKTGLQLLHPFMPFLTEELWEGMNYNSEIKRIIVAPWPEQSLNFNIDQETVDYVEGKFDLIRIGRILRSDYNLNIKQEAKFFIHSKK